MIGNGLLGDASPPVLATVTSWAQCDRCNKWRRIPKSLADSLDEDAPWHCEGNPNEAFASCNVPQELTDQEIDQELSSDEQEDVLDHERVRRKKRPAVWQLVRENIYTHRRRKVQDEDDIMICQCRPPNEGGEGCGPDCLNRMLNIECVPGYCPCGDYCDNQMFSKRQYAKIDKRRAGAKGFGLYAAQDLEEGHFIIQYLGEVLEEEEYVRRKVYYQAAGQRHYYFMNVGNGEVIDACRKGALGRFINHSCEPNCETQKWVVQGELAIGLFTQRAVKAGEELTFDYNFERYGDKPMKCLCKAKNCRGFVGGTQETIAASNFEETEDASWDPEPIMVTEAEEDAALRAILDQNIGVGTGAWDEKLERRLAKLAKEHGVDLGEQEISADGSDAESSGRPDADKVLPAGSGPQLTKGKKAAAKSAMRAELLAPSEAAVKAASSMPPRKRLKHAAADEPSASAASTSTQVPAAKAAVAVGKRPGSAADMDDVPVVPVESTPTSATTTPLPQLQRKPSRVVLSALSRELQRGVPVTKVRRRSEIDRRLDVLVPSGRLRDANTTTIVKVLRLFNLCDIGAAGQPAADGSRRHRSPTRGPPPAQRCGSGAIDGGTPQANGLLNGVSSPTAGSALARPSSARSPALSPGKSPAHSGACGGNGAAEPGEVPLERAASVRRTSSPPRQRRHSSWDVEVESARHESTRLELTARQRARMADLSLLLDVIVNTSSSIAKRELVRCGLLRQLHSTLGRNVAPSYQVVLRKMLRSVEALPLTADDVHLTRSAHGTFGDILLLLTHHSDPEVRTKAQSLLRQYPMSACTRPVVRGCGSLPGGTMSPASGNGGRFSSAASSSTGFHWSSGGGPRPRPPSRLHKGGRGGPFMGGANGYGGSSPHPAVATGPLLSSPPPLGMVPPGGVPPPPANGRHLGAEGGPLQLFGGLPAQQPAVPPSPAGNGALPGRSPALSLGAAGFSAQPAPPSQMDADLMTRALRVFHTPSPSPHPPPGLHRTSSATPPPLLATPLGGYGASPASHYGIPTWHGDSSMPSLNHSGAGLPPLPPHLLADGEVPTPLPPGIGGMPGMKHVAPPPQPPPLAADGDAASLAIASAAAPAVAVNRGWDLGISLAANGFAPLDDHSPAGSPPRDLPPGFAPIDAGRSPGELPPPLPPPSSVQYQPAAMNGRVHAADEIEDVQMSDVSDGEIVDNAVLEAAAQPVGSSPAAAEPLPNGAANTAPPAHCASASPMSPAAPNDFFEVDPYDPAGSEALAVVADDWEEPNQEFEAYVSEVVRVRLGRHLQAPPPARIELKHAHALYAKVTGEVLEKERQAHRERQRMGTHKLIERWKLEPKIKEFIRDSVRRLNAPART